MCEKFKGIEVDILERMIDLLRERYSAASVALTFLEVMTQEYDIVGLANQRDVLSHFASICAPSKARREREENLANAEEHLRRAIVEPYQTAVEVRLDRFISEYDFYDRKLVKKEKSVKLDKIVNHDYIREEIETIKELLKEGRDKKNCNIWDTKWEEAVRCFTIAYEKIVKLDNLLASYRRQHYYVASSKKWWIIGCLMGAGIIIATLVTIFYGG